ncbi:uncharacterized protein J4E87_006438 [Alternaria ethzedia]|uniref:uncharacterized protein n=1 Tax=Alternaria ethzedia TaxID=181014 RepID=UPI0020C24818|nr:uncharacterized protein J4E87_006438 [Alternaria ethzedia]KAI4622496.1 hypothetical protein J4E87_006438 [Alternaria ethzedia]
MAPVGAAAAARQAEPILTRIVEQDQIPWYRKRNLRRLYALLLPTCIGIEMTSGFDSQMINAVQIAPTWRLYFNNPQGALLGIMSSAYNLGAICALPLVPYVNDRFGRRWAIFLGSWIMVVGSVVQAFSISAGMYVGARFILGFGIPFCIIAGSSLMGELAYPKERPIMTSLFNALWFVGSLIAAGVSYGTQSLKDDWAWRIPSLLQAGPSLLQIVFIFMIPESPRFLISKDRREEAYATLITYHAEGATTSPFAAAEMAQIEHTIRIELEHSKRSWREMIAVPGLRKRVIIGSFLGLFTQWSGNTLLSYYLNQLLNMIGYDDPGFVGKVNVGLNSWNLVNAVCISLLYFMFPETYGRTLEELAFLFEDHALADEATTHVEKQMEWAERRWSRIDERMSWEMDVVVPRQAYHSQGERGNDVGTLDTRETVQRHQYRRRNSSWEDLRQRE